MDIDAVVDIGGDVVIDGGVCGGVTSRWRPDDVTGLSKVYEKSSDEHDDIDDDDVDDGDDDGDDDLR